MTPAITDERIKDVLDKLSNVYGVCNCGDEWFDGPNGGRHRRSCGAYNQPVAVAAARVLIVALQEENRKFREQLAPKLPSGLNWVFDHNERLVHGPSAHEVLGRTRRVEGSVSWEWIWLDQECDFTCGVAQDESGAMKALADLANAERGGEAP